MVALIQSKNHAANKGKTAGKYQFDTHTTGRGLSIAKQDQMSNSYDCYRLDSLLLTLIPPF